MKPGDYQKHQAELRKAKPVRKLSREEISALEHANNLIRYRAKLAQKALQAGDEVTVNGQSAGVVACVKMVNTDT